MPAATPSAADPLKQAEERLQLIAKATQDTIWDWNLRTNEIWWNENFRTMFGYAVEAIGNDASSWTERIHPADKERVLRSIHAVIDSGGEHWQDEYRFRRADGSYAVVLDRGYTVHDGEGACRMVGSMQDISQRKKAEEKLVESEERLRLTVDSAGIGTWDFNLLTGRLNWDDRCKALFGLSPGAEIDYGVFLKGLHPEDRERVDAVVQEVFRPGSGGYFETEYRTVGIEDNRQRWVAARGRAFFNAEGKAYRFIGTVLDITGRKAIEEELKSSDERLREALLVAGTGTWKIDLETGIDTRDASLNRILGLEARETFIPAEDSFVRMHPDDQQRIRQALDTAVQTCGVYDEECRIFRPDGSMRWLRDRGQVVVDATGVPAYIIGAAIDITEEKQREESLKISEDRLREFFHNASVGMAMVSLNGSFLDVNPVFCRMLGYSKEELDKKDIQSLIHPDHLGATVQDMQRTILGEISGFSHEKKYIRKNGEVFWVQVRVSLVKDLDQNPKHLVGIVTDIDDKKKAEESLKLQARVLESMDEGVSVADENGFILYTNAAEDRMFGYAPGELIGKHVTVQNAYSPEENDAIVASVIAELQDHGYWNGEWHNMKRDGTHFFTYAHITSLELEGRKVLVCVQRDITDEKKAREILRKSAEELERRVAERTRELKEANEQLERSNGELEQFAYVTSHDLQEPLRKIKTFAYRIEETLREVPEGPVHGYLQKVIASSERMSTLIRDLLNYSRLTHEMQQPEPVDLSEVLREVLQDFELLIVQKSAAVHAGNLPVVAGIPLQLNQLFFNLVGNSLKFSRPGIPPEIRISCREVEGEAFPGLQEGTRYAEITFQDNGIGFHPKYREQIFEIFQRLHSRDQFAGTGIGLALSRRVVENHNGRIVAESEEGSGATFRVYLPV